MRVLIDDGMQIEVGTGIGKYTLYLYQEISKCKNIIVDLSEFKSDKKKSFKRLLYLIHINSKKYRNNLKQYDVVHFTNYAMPLRKVAGVKYVVTIHDLASYVCPDSLSKIYRIYNQIVVEHSMKNADVILTVSNSVKNEIISKWPKYKSKVKVAYPGFYYKNISDYKLHDYEHEKLRTLTGKFFLFVGTIETRKNLGIVLEAFSEILKKFPDTKLVLAGRPGHGFEIYENLIDSMEIKNNVFVTGYLSENDIAKLYKDALAYIFPTMYEGFGSTQLECMYYHTPLILSDIPTNREVSNEYGLFFELDSVTSLVKQMNCMLNGVYNRVIKNSEADNILDMFLWERLIDDYVKAYR